MKKYIEISEGAVARIDSGKFVNGSLHRDPETGKIVFHAYKERNRHRDKTIRPLEHGWVKESPARIKVYESIPKVIGTASIIGALEREMKIVKDALIDRELINRV